MKSVGLEITMIRFRRNRLERRVSGICDAGPAYACGKKLRVNITAGLDGIQVLTDHIEHGKPP